MNSLLSREAIFYSIKYLDNFFVQKKKGEVANKGHVALKQETWEKEDWAWEPE